MTLDVTLVVLLTLLVIIQSIVVVQQIRCYRETCDRIRSLERAVYEDLD